MKKFLLLIVLIISSSIGIAQELNVGDYIVFKCHNVPDNFIRHQEAFAKISPVSNLSEYSSLDLWDATFIVEKGLANSSDEYVSFRSANIPNYYLRHQNGRLLISQKSNDDLFIKDATWKVNKGFSSDSKFSFSTYQWNSIFLRHQDAVLKITDIKSQLDKDDATWQVITKNEMKTKKPVTYIEPPRPEECKGRYWINKNSGYIRIRNTHPTRKITVGLKRAGDFYWEWFTVKPKDEIQTAFSSQGIVYDTCRWTK